MVSEIPGSNAPGGGSYHPKYPLNDVTFPVWKKFWEKLFVNQSELSHDEVSQMTDNFLDFTSREMGRVLAHALKVQKAINRAMETGESPDPV